MAFFFYAGHGVSIDGANYLLPVDIPAGDSASEGLIKFSAIPEATIVETLKAREVRVAAVVLDACRNNPFSRGGTRSFGDGTRGLSRPPTVQIEGVFGLYSAGFGEAALDRLGDDDPDPNSVFTRVLVPKLSEPGQSLLDIAYAVNEEVAQLAASVGHEQNPAYYDQARARDIYLAAAEEEPEPDRGSEPAATEASGSESCAGAQVHFEAAREINRVEALQDHVDRFGNCPFASLAQLLIEQFEAPDEEREVAAVSPTLELEESENAGATSPHLEECARQVDPSDGEPNSERAISACQRAVERLPESADAKYLLARAFENADNQTEAINWYRSAGEAGHADAQNRLGLKYDLAEGVPADDVEAVKWYRMAAEQDLSAAQVQPRRYVPNR